MKNNKQTLEQVFREKHDKIMGAINRMAFYYRNNPHRFVKEYLNVELKLFQKIIIFMLCRTNYGLYAASRGQGKSFLIAIYLVVMCILYPGTKVVVVSRTIGQANEVIQKITNELCQKFGWGSANLNSEIKYKSDSINNAKIIFHGGSIIQVAASNDNARHFRANIIVVDEFVKVDLGIINNVIRRFLTAPRKPGFLEREPYKYDLDKYLEPNREVYASSAWMKNHWSFRKMKSYLLNMIDGKDFFCCNIPYQLPLKEGLLMRNQIEAEMSESTFDEFSFKIEMEAIWYGSNNDAFFKYDDLNKNCNLYEYMPCFDDLKTFELIKKKYKIPEVKQGNRRILSIDVALMSSKRNKNDASSMIINDAVLNNGSVYTANIVMIDTKEGLTTDELGMYIMRYYYLYKCTDIVIDAKTFGLSVIDYIIKDHYDNETGNLFKALNVCNNEEIAERCHVPEAPRVIWAIQGSPSFNTKICLRLRSGFANNNINLLVNHYDGEEYIENSIKSFKNLNIDEKKSFIKPFYETELLMHELINLQQEGKGHEIKLVEPSGMRKDRYSSIAYNYWVMKEIEAQRKPDMSDDDMFSFFKFRKPAYLG